jgi:hypothetical protein
VLDDNRQRVEKRQTVEQLGLIWIDVHREHPRQIRERVIQVRKLEENPEH